MRRVILALLLAGALSPAWAGPSAETTARLRALAEARAAGEQLRLARLLLADIDRVGVSPTDGPPVLTTEDQVAILRELLVHPARGVQALAVEAYVAAPFALQRETDDKLWRRHLERTIEDELAALDELEKPEQRTARARALLRPRDQEEPEQHSHRLAYLLRRLLGHADPSVRLAALAAAPALRLPLPVPPELREAAERLAFRSTDAGTQRSLVGLLRGWRVPAWEHPLVEWLLDERSAALATDRPARAEEALGLLRRYLQAPAETRREVAEFLATSARPSVRDLAGRLQATEGATATGPDPVLRWHPEEPPRPPQTAPRTMGGSYPSMPRPRPTDITGPALIADSFSTAGAQGVTGRYVADAGTVISGLPGTPGPRTVAARPRCPEFVDREGRTAINR